MPTRRVFAACGICAALGLVAERVEAQPSPSPSGGIKRTILGREDAPDSKYETVQMIVEVDAGVEIARHTHPGVESTTLLAGACDLYVKDRPDRTLTAGEVFLVPAYVPHGVRSVPSPVRFAVTYVVEKGKPIASPAPD